MAGFDPLPTPFIPWVLLKRLEAMHSGQGRDGRLNSNPSFVPGFVPDFAPT